MIVKNLNIYFFDKEISKQNNFYLKIIEIILYSFFFTIKNYSQKPENFLLYFLNKLKSINAQSIQNAKLFFEVFEKNKPIKKEFESKIIFEKKVDEDDQLISLSRLRKI